MKYFIFSILLLSVGISHADPEIVQASPRYCKPGPEFQPNGLFAVYTFCDDALGTNIAIYLYKLGIPINGKYDLGKRFWQGEEWSYDVTSWAWLPNDKLLLATSYIYGSGKLYRLDLLKQEFKVLHDGRGVNLVITEVKDGFVTVEYEVEDGKTESTVVAM